MRPSFILLLMPAALSGVGCDSAVDVDPFAACEGKGYAATILEPSDGATDVATDAMVRYELPPTISDRYTAMMGPAGYLTSDEEGTEGTSVWERYPFSPKTQYTFEIGWICVINGGEQDKVIPLDTATFTTAP